MSKISNSIHKEFIDNAILEDGMSFGQLELELVKRGFKVSKATLSTYAKELKASTKIDNESKELLTAEIQDITGENNNLDYRKEMLKKQKILYEMYDMTVNNAYMVTKHSIQSGRVVPLNLYKSISELQKLLETQKRLLKDVR